MFLSSSLRKTLAAKAKQIVSTHPSVFLFPFRFAVILPSAGRPPRSGGKLRRTGA
jgi:hypothetical protein